MSGGHCYQICRDGVAEARVFESYADASNALLDMMAVSNAAWKNNQRAVTGSLLCCWERVAEDGGTPRSIHIVRIRFVASDD